jgi:hypothetical protein
MAVSYSPINGQVRALQNQQERRQRTVNERPIRFGANVSTA